MTSALKRVDSDPPEYRLRVTSGEGAAAATFLVDAIGVELERADLAELAPGELDYRIIHA